MLLATLLCSDPVCTAELEYAIEVLQELDGLACDCGYGYVLIGVASVAGR